MISIQSKNLNSKDPLDPDDIYAARRQDTQINLERQTYQWVL
jgi:hypothetical protein